jgi:phosphomannomutase
VRPSGTEDVLRLHVEADSWEQVAQGEEAIRQAVAACPLLN